MKQESHFDLFHTPRTIEYVNRGFDSRLSVRHGAEVCRREATKTSIASCSCQPHTRMMGPGGAV